MAGPLITQGDLDLLLLIREFESALLELFAAGEIGGTTHTCLGQEYVPVALAPLLEGDTVVSNHRGHGHYLAHVGDPESLLAEIMGREGALCHGVGGSQHLYQSGFLSTGVQGEGVPVAVGIAVHFKHTGQERIAVAYVGDGTFGEGSVYEALNMAALWQVPLLVVVENNGIAQSTPTRHAMAGTVGQRAAAFGIDFRWIEGTDIDHIRAEVAPLIARVRSARTPLVLEFDTVRLGPHSKGDDTRSAQELSALAQRDWYHTYAGDMAPQLIEAEWRQRRRVADLVATIRRRPPSRWEAL
jgi:acetoin:2,6-dichlorophenolindophenol oxidoreductase subunit alpha